MNSHKTNPGTEYRVYPRKPDPRTEYRVLQNARVNASDSLGQKFPGLKSLTVSLEYFDPTGLRQNGGSIKYKANLVNAKSALWFNCRGLECVGGDYDLSEELSQAVQAQRKTVTGTKHCQGVRHNLSKKEQVSCQSLLRYVLRLEYVVSPPPACPADVKARTRP